MSLPCSHKDFNCSDCGNCISCDYCICEVVEDD